VILIQESHRRKITNFEMLGDVKIRGRFDFDEGGPIAAAQSWSCECRGRSRLGARNHCAKALTVNLSDSTKAAPYNAANTSASNLGLTSRALENRLTGDRKALEETQPELAGKALHGASFRTGRRLWTVNMCGTLTLALRSGF
jgi:hypothetical protein